VTIHPPTFTPAFVLEQKSMKNENLVENCFASWRVFSLGVSMYYGAVKIDQYWFLALENSSTTSLVAVPATPNSERARLAASEYSNHAAI
jgi:hypothetical protein